MDLSDRLKTLGVRLGNGAISPTQPTHHILGHNTTYPVERVVDGIEIQSEYGPVFAVEKRFQNSYVHGKVSLNNFLASPMLASWAKSSRLLEIDKTQIVFLDTETSGLAGGTGTYAFMVGLGFFDQDSFTVTQLFLRNPAEELALLSALNTRLAAFQAVVTFNGKAFDIPLLNTRTILNGASPLFTDVDHVDLLHLARRLWRNRLPSRTMGDLEREIIEFFREQADIPGYLIPQYYFDYLMSGDARPLEGIFYHNRIDIVSLAALYSHVATVLEHPDPDELPSLDIVSIARLYEEQGKLEEAAELFTLGLSAGLPQEVFLATINRFALLRRKQRQFESAAILWEKSARLGDLDACCELAKILEHTLKRTQEAMEWTQFGIDILQNKNFPRYQSQAWSNDLNKRLVRLEKKVKNGK